MDADIKYSSCGQCGDNITKYEPVQELSQYKTYLFLCTLHAVMGIAMGFIVNQIIKNLMAKYPKIPLAFFFFLQLFVAISVMFLLEYYSNDFAHSWTNASYGILFVTLYFLVQENFAIYVHKLFYY